MISKKQIRGSKLEQAYENLIKKNPDKDGVRIRDLVEELKKLGAFGVVENE